MTRVTTHLSAVNFYPAATNTNVAFEIHSLPHYSSHLMYVFSDTTSDTLTLNGPQIVSNENLSNSVNTTDWRRLLFQYAIFFVTVLEVQHVVNMEVYL